VNAISLPGRHRAQTYIAPSGARRRFARPRRRPLLCSSMRRRDVIILVVLVTLVWVAVGYL